MWPNVVYTCALSPAIVLTVLPEEHEPTTPALLILLIVCHHASKNIGIDKISMGGL